MKKISVLILAGIFIIQLSKAQQSVSIGTSQLDGDAVLWLAGDGKQGLLLPRTTNVNAMPLKRGMIVYDVVSSKIFFCDGTNWNPVGSGSSSANQIQITGNAITLGAGSSNSISLASNFSPGSKGFLYWDGNNWTHLQLTLPPSGTLALVWNGISWTLSPLTISGNAGGDLAGTYPNPTIKPDAVVSSTILDGTITGSDLASNININTSGTITAGSTNLSSLNIAGAVTTGASANAGTVGQVLTSSGPGAAPTWTTPAGTLPSISANQLLSNNGSNTAVSVAGDLDFLVSGTTGTFTIKPGVITSSRILDGTISGSDLASNISLSTTGTVTAGSTAVSSLSVSGALSVGASPTAGNSGQVLTSSGPGVAPTWTTPAGTLPSISANQLLSNNGSNTAVSVAGDLDFLVSGTTGTFTIKPGVITSSRILDGTITGSDLASNISLSTTGTVTAGSTAVSSLSVSGALSVGASSTAGNSGQVLTSSGPGVAPTWTTPAGTLPSISVNQLLSNNGSNAGINVSGDLSLNVSGNTGTFTINSDVIDGSKILNASITGTDINSMGASAGQVLAYDGSTWAPAINTPSFSAQSGNQILASPNGAAGTPSFRSLADTDIPGLSATKIISGTLPVSRGGTGISSAFNGQLLIGNGTGFSLNTLTAGTGISIANTSGSITLSTSGNFGTQNLVTSGSLSSSGASVSGSNLNVNSVNYAWPGSQGLPNTVLTNNGSGGLSWAVPSTYTNIDIIPKGSASGLVDSRIFDNGTNVSVNGPIDTRYDFVVYNNSNMPLIGTSFPSMRIGDISGSTYMFIDYADDTRFSFMGGGVGVGTLNPVSALDVRGKITMVDGTQADGYVLKSDASGTASWAPLAAAAFSVCNVTSAITINPSTSPGWIRLNFNSKEYDLANNFSTSNSTFTVPADGTGLYHFSGNIVVPFPLNVNYCRVGIFVNGTLKKMSAGTLTTGTEAGVHIDCDISLSANDAVTFAIYNPTTTNSIILSGGCEAYYFQGRKVD